jgi:excisionase family DNA binding protein
MGIQKNASVVILGSGMNKVKLKIDNQVEPLALSVEHAAFMLGVSRSKAWAIVKTGELRSVRAGNRVLIPITAIHAFLGNE